MIAAVIFDLDDTLYLETDYVRSGFRAVAEWLAAFAASTDSESAAAEYERELWRAFGIDRAHAFDSLVDRLSPGFRGNRNDLVQRMLAVYRGHKPDIRLCDDARAVLPILAAGYRLGMVTDGDRERQRRKVAGLGIGRFFGGVVVTGVNPGWTKPSPDAFRAVAATLGCPPAECVYVGDNPAKDFTGPRRIGMPAVRVRRKGGLHETLEPAPGAEPDETITDLMCLPGLLPVMDRGRRERSRKGETG